MSGTMRVHLLALVLVSVAACTGASPEAGALADSGLAAMRRGDSAGALQRYDQAIARSWG